MTYYVITKGSYSDYHICAVTTDKEKAKRLQILYSDSYDPAYIEEYIENETDFEKFKKEKELELVFSVEKELKDSKLTIYNRFFMPDLYGERVELNRVHSCGTWLQTYVSAKDEDEALKKASDLFARYQAEMEGL